jgi:ABC-type uncharacterized transport system substrate-binding protein
VVTVDLAAKPTDLPGQIGGKDVRLVIAVGNSALAAAERYGTAPVIAAMLLRSDLALARPPWSAVVLDLTLTEVLSGLARVFPGKARAGLIRNPEVDPQNEALLIAQAKAAGMTLKVVDCPRPERLLQALLSMRNLVDFVWCPPDSTLFNGTTVQPLLRTSLDSGLPVAGFSASFVQSGAAAGVYPDYREMGAQAGELARKYLSGASPAGIEGPRRIRVAANARVARLLGIRLAQRDGSDTGIVVIE